MRDTLMQPTIAERLMRLARVSGFAMILAVSPAHAEEVLRSCGNADVEAIRFQMPQKSDRPFSMIDPTITAAASAHGEIVTVTVLSPEFDTLLGSTRRKSPVQRTAF
jgi:hypothetical protein